MNKMTMNRIRPVVGFGEFFNLCKTLWIICRTLDDDRFNQDLMVRLLEEKYQVITKLCDEYKKWNYSLDEFYYCVRQISLKNQLLNPFNFEWKRHAYKIHISNCFLLNL